MGCDGGQGGWLVVVGVGLWDAEDGYEPVGSADLDFGDECFDECFALLVGAGLDDDRDVRGDGVEGGGGGCDGFAGDLIGQFAVAVAELFLLGAEFREAFPDGFFVDGAMFECGEVAVDRPVGLGEFGVDGGEFGA
ncbi:hypothetical protein CcI156_18115 [Frankia sp. CcI156]|uniref:hypothetical protein n=1 Tax=unclassified Frankia TaxID=2632575 RepID=UPI00056028C1|nr:MULTISPECIES: hypothetical protein [unclassified Frankia]OFB43839.1 hypothetical protein Manayef4_10520 [Frankia sp. CgIM4]ONH23574.1 hypothetical protein CcI156_18115 [Frankia sp. CcI156]